MNLLLFYRGDLGYEKHLSSIHSSVDPCFYTPAGSEPIFRDVPQENKHWEDSFQVYERGVHIFKYPHVKDIWTAYLTKFVGRYGGKKLERARDLFEQALEKVHKP